MLLLGSNFSAVWLHRFCRWWAVPELGRVLLSSWGEVCHHLVWRRTLTGPTRCVPWSLHHSGVLCLSSEVLHQYYLGASTWHSSRRASCCCSTVLLLLCCWCTPTQWFSFVFCILFVEICNFPIFRSSLLAFTVFSCSWADVWPLCWSMGSGCSSAECVRGCFLLWQRVAASWTHSTCCLCCFLPRPFSLFFL